MNEHPHDLHLPWPAPCRQFTHWTRVRFEMLTCTTCGWPLLLHRAAVAVVDHSTRELKR